MSNKRINKYIPTAIHIIEEYKKKNNDKIPSEFKGYISSFGASIIQSGVIPTLAFYLDKNNDISKRSNIVEFIRKIINKEEGKNVDCLLAYVIENKKEHEYLKNLIKDAAIAVKLAIRVFKIGGDDDEK